MDSWFEPYSYLLVKEKASRSGIRGLLRKSPAFTSNKKISRKTIIHILTLGEKWYYNFNITPLRDKLHEVRKMPSCYASIWQIFIKNHAHVPRRKRKIYRQSHRVPKADCLFRWTLRSLPDSLWWKTNMVPPDFLNIKMQDVNMLT